MISIQKLLFDLDTKVNRLANLRGQYIPDETKIEVLNIVQLKLVLKKLGLNNNYQLGMDAFNKRYQDLQILQVPFEKLTLTKTTGDVLNSYTGDISALSKKLLIPVSGYVLADKGNCKGRKLDIGNFIKHADLIVYLSSPHHWPDFKYEETFASVSSGKFFVYSDKKDSFTINDLYISYLRYPVDMDISGYVHLDGSASSDVDCELESYLENELLDLAVEEIADATANQLQAQLSRTRTKENE